MDQRKIIIRYVIDATVVPPKLWERLILNFCKTYSITGPLGTLWFKCFGGRMYILRRELIAPAQLSAPFDGGRLQPWLN